MCSKRSCKKIEKIQERALRLTYKDYVSDYELLLAKSKRCSMYAERLRMLAICVFKILNDQMKPVSKDFYKIKNSNYSLRNEMCLDRPIVNTVTYGINSLRYQGILTWDKLHIDVKKSEDLETFKKVLRM